MKYSGVITGIEPWPSASQADLLPLHYAHLDILPALSLAAAHSREKGWGFLLLEGQSDPRFSALGARILIHNSFNGFRLPCCGEFMFQPRQPT